MKTMKNNFYSATNLLLEIIFYLIIGFLFILFKRYWDRE